MDLTQACRLASCVCSIGCRFDIRRKEGAAFPRAATCTGWRTYMQEETTWVAIVAASTKHIAPRTNRTIRHSFSGYVHIPSCYALL
jgi:hypothetical protein